MPSKQCESFLMRFRFAFFPAMVSTPVYGQDALRYKYQFYNEEDGRIDVESHYLDYDYSWGSTTYGLRLAVDSLSGMTPTGTHARNDQNEWLYQYIEDTRYVTVATIEHELDEYTLTFEYAHSSEEDYRSNALTGKVSRQFNEKNTTVTGGLSYAFDKVVATGFTNIFEDRDKDTLDLYFGVSQIVTPNTLLDVNVGYGYSEGYLSDPYRRINQIKSFVIDTPFGPFPVTETFNYPENRPDELHRFVAKGSLRHYIEPFDAALKTSYRLFSNSDSLEGHTFELRWIQQATSDLSVEPYLRYYRQSGADFYYPTLTGTSVDGSDLNDGSSPHYSSDYRLASLDAWTYGLRFAWKVNRDFTLDFQYERYEMNGRDPGTPSEFFPTANVITLGGEWQF